MSGEQDTARGRVVTDLERRRCEATVAGDLATLRTLMDPGCVYVHGNGMVQDGATYLTQMAAEGSHYVELTTDEVTSRCTGSVVVLTYRRQSLMRFGDDQHSSRSRCLAVWSDDGSGPRLVAFQATGLA